MENNFTKKMSIKTDEELIQIVTIDSNKYQEVAIEAAKKEIELRQIDLNQFKFLAEKVEIEKQKVEKVERKTVPSKIRFFNFVIDFIIILILYGLIIPNLETFLSLTNSTSRAIYRLCTLIIFVASYYIILEHKYQKSIGKMVTKTKVVNQEGGKAEFEKIVSRTFCRFIPFDRFSFFFTKNGFHDAISGTKVIKDN